MSPQNVTEPLIDPANGLQNAPTPTAINASFETTSTTSETLRSRIAESKYTWLLALASGMLLAFTLIYAFATSSVTHPLIFVTDSTTATRNLRILSEGVTLSLTALMAASADIVVWAAASSERGITFSTWLAMSTGTGIRGLLKLIGWKHQSEGARDLHHFWIIVRYA